VREETLALWRAAGMDAALYEKRRKERPFNFADVTTPLPPGFTRVAEGSRLRIGGRDWDVRIGNGHAPEHATFWSRDDNLVLAGDQILPGISPNLGVYSTEPAADPVGEWLESCTALQPFAREDHLVLPGHKLPFTGLPLRLAQLIQNHHSALERLLLALESPLRVSDCFPALFRRPIGESEYGLALSESLGHLNHLLGTGQVVRRTDENGVWLWQRAAA
jgi:glyoxylase-like metal-dependent hydrolase (beta-lactamase superfamily II)